MSSKLAELEEELAKATSDLEQEKAATSAQLEEIEALKKVCNIIYSETCITRFFIAWGSYIANNYDKLAVALSSEYLFHC